MLRVSWKSCYSLNNVGDSMQYDDAPLNKTCHWYSNVPVMNASGPAADVLPESAERMSSLALIALRMINSMSKMIGILYALGFFFTVFALVGYIKSPGGQQRAMISATFAFVSPIHNASTRD